MQRTRGGKIADHGTNGPRKFFRSPERMKRRKEKGKGKIWKVKNRKSIFCQNHKDLIDSRY